MIRKLTENEKTPGKEHNWESMKYAPLYYLKSNSNEFKNKTSD